MRRFPPRWEYQVSFSSQGLIYGYAFTKRRAKKKLIQAQCELLRDD